MVALPFKAGWLRSSQPRVQAERRGRVGIRGSLFMAFGGLAAIALVISAGAGILLSRLGDRIDELSGTDIPRLATALQLATISEALASRAPALLQAANEESRQEQHKFLKSAREEAAAKIAAMRKLNGDENIIGQLDENTANLGAMIDSLAKTAKERLDTARQQEEQFANMRRAHDRFRGTISLAVSEARADVSRALAQTGGEKEASVALQLADAVSGLLADENAIVADFSAAPAAKDTDVLDKYKEAYKAARERMEKGILAVNGTSADETIRDAMTKVLAFGDGKGSIFTLRAREIQDAEFNQITLDEMRKLSSGMNSGVKDLVEAVRTTTADSAERAHRLISLSTLIMTAAGIATLIGSVLFVWLYVGRNILRRIANLQLVMRRLADGDLQAELAASRTQDEVAEMARSLEVFRESMIRARALSTEQDMDRQAKAERTSKMEARIASFEETVRSALDTLTASANAMQSTAETMSVTADKSSALASAVASAAEETSVNVQTVSSGTEELSSSIAEISRQVTASTAVAGKAVAEAGDTDATMQGLADCASRISTVVDLIQHIASQTNLLALNATIEAARAGESGRGFAVVASEVKNLADQTAKATDEIRSQILTMQNVASSAVGAIRHIGQTIGEINEVTTAIAAAVEEQGAATREIARNIQHAASGTGEVTSNIIGVSEASSNAGAAAAEVLSASAGLRREADLLREEIDGFLAGIRAA